MPASVRDVIQIALRIGLLQIDGGGHDPVAHGEQSGSHARRSTGALAPAPRWPAASPARPKGLATLSRLASTLPDGDGAHVVDAETAGRLLGVTSRTARRLLHGLVDEGLAWPLPPNRIPQPGRPRQFYRLVTENLDSRPS